MKILALDSSGLVASVAYLEDGIVKGNININNKKTHSQTLLPMLDDMVKMLGLDINEIDCIAVANGPGSFTGLRIGVATVKGLGLGINKPVVGVSTLEALSLNWQGFDGLVVPIMDARRSQVYTGVYKFKKGNVRPEVIIEPCSFDAKELCEKLNEMGERVCFTGDGVPVYEEIIKGTLKVDFLLPLPTNAYQNAGNVAVLGEAYVKEGLSQNAADLTPVYLRKPQAEREREEMLRDSN